MPRLVIRLLSRSSWEVISLICLFLLTSCSKEYTSFGASGLNPFTSQKSSKENTPEESTLTPETDSAVIDKFDMRTYEGLAAFYEYLHGPHGETLWQESLDLRLSDLVEDALENATNETYETVGFTFENMRDFFLKHHSQLRNIAIEYATQRDLLAEIGIYSRFDLTPETYIAGMEKAHRYILEDIRRDLKQNKESTFETFFPLQGNQQTPAVEGGPAEADKGGSSVTPVFRCVLEVVLHGEISHCK